MRGENIIRAFSGGGHLSSVSVAEMPDDGLGNYMLLTFAFSDRPTVRLVSRDAEAYASWFEVCPDPIQSTP